ncbi:Putative RNA recognition motif domain, nucleotide-binding alpha-beta plait domain superfamily [Septoria linicola]|uniref:RNA recognition motif domain, nucleotide-binding alpha-beta plait domain superfamily n=1 Tax=Septoria linicola TaxID=215465 RepID=A0A9Q9B2R3_9PEZI|nr:Putative RNA recognition motif domain, nucleotide-binding alpha-beta plait domain superfamily [Septoria linicola]
MARKGGGRKKADAGSLARQILDGVMYENQHVNKKTVKASESEFSQDQFQDQFQQQYYLPNIDPQCGEQQQQQLSQQQNPLRESGLANYGYPQQVLPQNHNFAPNFNSYAQAPTHSHPAAAMSYNPYGNQGYNAQGYNAQYSQYAAPPGYGGGQYAQQAQQYETPPQIRNPFAPPPPAASAYAAQNAGFDPDREADIAQWQAQFASADQQFRGKKTGKDEPAGNANLAPLGQRSAGGAAVAQADKKDDGKYTVVRKGGGETWEDKSLLEWDPNKFRIMVGNLAGEVTDDSLAKAFASYGVSKARVVRDKRTTKSKGFGFVEFEEGELGFKAAREMSGKYIGSHPVTIQRSKTDVRPATKKDNNKYKGKNNRDKSKDKDKKKKDDPLKAHTGAGVEKKLPAKTATGLKLLG